MVATGEFRNPVEGGHGWRAVAITADGEHVLGAWDSADAHCIFVWARLGRRQLTRILEGAGSPGDGVSGLAWPHLDTHATAFKVQAYRVLCACGCLCVRCGKRGLICIGGGVARLHARSSGASSWGAGPPDQGLVRRPQGGRGRCGVAPAPQRDGQPVRLGRHPAVVARVHRALERVRARLPGAARQRGAPWALRSAHARLTPPSSAAAEAMSAAAAHSVQQQQACECCLLVASLPGARACLAGGLVAC